MSVASFVAIAGTVLYTSCEKNPCNHVNCLNGGSCNKGTCRCPTGYEGPQCETKAVSRFIGVYPGFTGCDAGAQVIDTAFITEDFSNFNYVYVRMKNDNLATGKILHGYVSSNESVYSIIITNNDSERAGSQDYLKTWSVTLQDDKKLVVSSYERNQTNTDDTFVHTCYFLGFKQ
jgi:hypothetical protein